MSVQAVPHLRTVRRLNRSASKVRVKEEGVQPRLDDEEKENRINIHKEGKENRSKIPGLKKETRSKFKMEDKQNKTKMKSRSRDENIEEMKESATNNNRYQIMLFFLKYRIQVLKNITENRFTS